MLITLRVTIPDVFKILSLDLKQLILAVNEVKLLFPKH